MSKQAHDKIAAGLTEVMEIARGDAEPAAVHGSGSVPTIAWRRTGGHTWEVTIDRRSAEERERQVRWLNYEAQAAMSVSDCGAAYQGMAPPKLLGGWFSPL